ncbi:hypothetical protein V3595_28450 [Bacillus sp. CFBP9009]
MKYKILDILDDGGKNGFSMRYNCTNQKKNGLSRSCITAPFFYATNEAVEQIFIYIVAVIIENEELNL